MKEHSPLRLAIVWLLSSAVYVFQLWIFGYAMPILAQESGIEFPKVSDTELNYLFLAFPPLFALASFIYFKNNARSYAEDSAFAPAFIPFLTFVVYLTTQLASADVGKLFGF
jgi:hypothetical protein